MTIRPAVLEDVPQIVDMGARFLSGTTYSQFLQLRPERMSQLAIGLIRGGAGQLLVAVSPAEIVIGMLGIAIGEHPIDGARVASELFWWAEPSVRGSLVGKRLKEAATDWAREVGAARILWSAPNERVARLYERWGFGRVEFVYQQDL